MNEVEMEKHVRENDLTFFKDHVVDDVEPMLLYARNTVYNSDKRLFYFRTINLNFYKNEKPIFLVSAKYRQFIRAAGDHPGNLPGKLFTKRYEFEAGEFSYYPDKVMPHNGGIRFASNETYEMLYVYETR